MALRLAKSQFEEIHPLACCQTPDRKKPEKQTGRTTCRVRECLNKSDNKHRFKATTVNRAGPLRDVCNMCACMHAYMLPTVILYIYTCTCVLVCVNAYYKLCQHIRTSMHGYVYDVCQIICSFVSSLFECLIVICSFNFDLHSCINIRTASRRFEK